MSEHGDADDPTGSETGVALTGSDVSVRSAPDAEQQEIPTDSPTGSANTLLLLK